VLHTNWPENHIQVVPAHFYEPISANEQTLAYAFVCSSMPKPNPAPNPTTISSRITQACTASGKKIARHANHLQLLFGKLFGIFCSLSKFYQKKFQGK
jgi:hypothetical protein